ncbi:hypothetical protein HNQ91_001147 [Filimonas zeae]|uniref:Uncharacterized protein n=1 Tax=Filimonas zeae TaxID=1737353 RepID=A0A917MSQ2_9BACT|nr:hypothetical protein [Filimonas zeae]MDR6338125.1 hypothetical protein [Filimonas zeae]GGH61844.1 hypothetical protein GCM10011379_11220 [Filimonas zeae]
MKQLILLPLLLYCITSGAQTQTDSTAQQNNDSTAAREKSTFTIGAVYANNANYYGLKSDEKMAYIATAASYKHRSGFYLNGVAYRLLNDSAHFVSAYNAGAGFAFTLSKRLTADISYSYTFFPKLSPFIQAANPHNTSLTLSHSSWLTTSLGVDYAFGKTNDVFTTLGISKQLNLFSITSKDIITLTPVIDVTAGTQRFYNYYTEEKTIRDSVLGILPSLLGGGSSGSTTSTTTTQTVTSFDLLSYNLKLPLAYNRASYLVEFACQLSLLGQKVQSAPGKLNSFYTASFYYQF